LPAESHVGAELFDAGIEDTDGICGCGYSGLDSGGVYCGQDQCDQQGDDPDDDHKFDEGKGTGGTLKVES